MTENTDESTNLEQNMESLQLNEDMIEKDFKFDVKSDATSPSVSSSNSRPASTNRRYSLRPIKQKESTNEFKASSTRKKRLSHPENMALETIFENPVCRNGSIKLLGKKLKRFISFNNFVTKARHRQLKIKRLTPKVKKVKVRTKITIEDVRQKLQSLEETDDENDTDWMDITG
uniref:Tantalus-like domain-containing protein n=1 Tax=Homalodisca liturata TaxID=320908 RepID=A0A1B6IES5_9HEMI